MQDHPRSEVLLNAKINAGLTQQNVSMYGGESDDIPTATRVASPYVATKERPPLHPRSHLAFQPESSREQTNMTSRDTCISPVEPFHQPKPQRASRLVHAASRPVEMVTLQIDVPPGVRAGQYMLIDGPEGEAMSVVVPAGLRPGMSFRVEVPIVKSRNKTSGRTITRPEPIKAPAAREPAARPQITKGDLNQRLVLMQSQSVKKDNTCPATKEPAVTDELIVIVTKGSLATKEPEELQPLVAETVCDETRTQSPSADPTGKEPAISNFDSMGSITEVTDLRESKLSIEAMYPARALEDEMHRAGTPRRRLASVPPRSGLAILEAVKVLKMRQLFAAVEHFTDWRMDHKFQVLDNDTSKQLFEAQESTAKRHCRRICCVGRDRMVRVHDTSTSNRSEIMYMKRPWHWSALFCGQPRLDVFAPNFGQDTMCAAGEYGANIGTVVVPYLTLGFGVDVYSKDGEYIFKIRATRCQAGLYCNCACRACKRVRFVIYEVIEGVVQDEPAGILLKFLRSSRNKGRWPFIKDENIAANNFYLVIGHPSLAPLSAQSKPKRVVVHKALLMAAVFLVDMTHFSGIRARPLDRRIRPVGTLTHTKTWRNVEAGL